MSACGERDDELVFATGAASNLSLSCWLRILSEESSLDLHGDSANLAVSLVWQTTQQRALL